MCVFIYNAVYFTSKMQYKYLSTGYSDYTIFGGEIS